MKQPQQIQLHKTQPLQKLDGMSQILVFYFHQSFTSILVTVLTDHSLIPISAKGCWRYNIFPKIGRAHV